MRRILALTVWAAFALMMACALAPDVALAQNQYEQKAERLTSSIQAGDVDSGTYYDAACNFALAGKTEEAFRYLEEAINRGFANVDHIKVDPDLQTLHADPRWPGLLEKATAKRSEQQSRFYNQKAFWDNSSLQLLTSRTSAKTRNSRASRNSGRRPNTTSPTSIWSRS